MALVILEGLDRTGKTSVAQSFVDKGYQLIHMSAPDKAIGQPGYVGPSYLDQMVELLTSFSGHDVVLDRSHYGELVWPQIYNRKGLLSEEDMEILLEIESTLDVTKILMVDPNAEAHWQRCVDNKEPLTKVQFVKARSLFSNVADKYGFERKTLKDFTDAAQPLPPGSKSAAVASVVDGSKSDSSSSSSSISAGAATGQFEDNKSKEQLKLERANAINEVLSKRVIKSKGPMFDELERGVRHFLNSELGKLFGNVQSNMNFTNEEVELLKFFCQRLKDKE
jgi:hypothetical protein